MPTLDEPKVKTILTFKLKISLEDKVNAVSTVVSENE